MSAAAASSRPARETTDGTTGTRTRGTLSTSKKMREVHRRASSSTFGTTTSAPALVDWLSATIGDASLPSKIRVTDRGRAFGTRGVEAVRDLSPGETLARVPFGLTLRGESDDDGNDAWSSRMAMEILEELHASTSTSTSTSSTSAYDRSVWLSSLPRPAPETPPLDFSDEELAMIEDEDVVAEARAVRAVHERACETFADRLAAIGATMEDLRWATSAVHSRVFARRDEATGKTTRILVPGVDMCNHGGPDGYNAIVRIVTSPETCQGLSATEEIADVSARDADAEEKFFELVVDPDGQGIEAGDEILISYSNTFPNEPFLLYFGFVPSNNPNDAFALFRGGVDDLITHCRDVLNLDVSDDQIDAIRAIFDTKNESSSKPISCTIDSVDATLIEACERILNVPWIDVVGSRARNVLTSGQVFSTKIREDIAILDDPTVSERVKLAVRYRLNKKSILIAPLGQSLDQYYIQK